MYRNWRQLGAILLLLAMIASFAACGGNTTEDQKNADSPNTSNQQSPQPTDETKPPEETDPLVEAEQEPEVIKVTLKDTAKSAMETMEVWDGSVAESFDGGDGSSTNPYQIANGAQLAKLAEDVNSGIDFEGKYFVLTSDIVLNRFEDWDFENIYQNMEFTENANEWIPIGVYNSFMGDFNGDNYTIYGMQCTAKYNVVSMGAFSGAGLFGHIRSAHASNVNLVCSKLLCIANHYGGIVGVNDWSNVENCHSEQIVILPLTTCDTAGCVVGNGSEDKCYNCSASGLIITAISNYIGGDSSYSGYFGGVAGETSEIYNCYSDVDIIVDYDLSFPKSGEGKMKTTIGVGGVIGGVWHQAGNCFNAGNIAFIGPHSEWEAPHDSRYNNTIAVGGVAGLCRAEQIDNCANIGIIDASLEFPDWVLEKIGTKISGYGDIFGLKPGKDVTLESWPQIFAGGIVGKAEKGTVSHCYSNQSVSNEIYPGNIGGIVGGANVTENEEQVMITNCYYNNNYLSNAVGYKSGSVFTDQIKGLTEDELKDSNNYYGFDFNVAWMLDDSVNSGLPFLRELIQFIQ